MAVLTAAIFQANILVMAGAINNDPPELRAIGTADGSELGGEDQDPLTPSTSATPETSAPDSEAQQPTEGAPTTGRPASPGTSPRPRAGSTPTTKRPTTPKSAPKGTAATTRPTAPAPAPTSPTSGPAASPTTVVTGPTQPAPTPGTSPMVAAVRNLQPFVEQARGLSFKSALGVKALDDAEFNSRLGGHRKFPSPAEAPRYEGFMRALGMIGSNVNLSTELAKLNNRTVVAFYDRKTKEIVVRNGDATPFVRSAVVHELTSALDDQWYGIDRPNLDAADNETGAAFAALVSGSADLVSERYLASLPEPERQAVNAERSRLASQVPADIPKSVLANFTFPYVAGPTLANALMNAGGVARLNAAFQAPPTTTEHLIDPARFLAGEGGVNVSAPQADGAVVRRGIVGQLGLFLLLSEVLSEDAARAASSGWGGDQFVSWRNSAGATCVRATFQMDRREDDRELSDALRQWASRRSGATIQGSGSGPVTLSRCA
ncbi:MAG: hypothetical protein ACRDV9_11220 [Acidimicrobiia bacterium]